jgi:hypothetical protein
VADGISTLIKHGVQRKEVELVKVFPRALGVSHLVFAHDTILFFHAKLEQAVKVSEIINIYASTTG